MRSPVEDTETPQLQHILSRMPEQEAASFTEAQRQALSLALRASTRHAVDFRPVMKIPLLPWSFYLVLLVGRNRRYMSPREQLLATKTLIGVLVSAIVILSLLGLLVMYLLKSALGIELIPGHHFGIWFWFEEVFLGR